MERNDPYKATIVCTMWSNKNDYAGVLSAKRVDSKEQAGDYMYDEILRLVEYFGGAKERDGNGGKVTVESFRDTFDEWVTEVKCADGSIYDYKLIFEEDEEVKENEAEDHETEEVSAEP